MYDISCLGSKRSETLFAKARVKQRSMITLFIQATAKIRLVFSTERKLEERAEPGGKAQVLSTSSLAFDRLFRHNEYLI